MNHKKLFAAVLAMSMSFSTVPFMNNFVNDNAITVSAASTEQVNVLPSLKATDKSNAVCHSNSDKAAFQMDGRIYYQGVVLTGKSSITFNVENINKLSWKLGHVDNTDRYNMTMKVYLDDELADSVPISWYMLAMDYDIDVSKASKIKIVMEGSSYGSYAMGDVTSDKESPSVTAKAREYSKVGDILTGCFDSNHVKIYQGNDKTAGFNMNGRTYHQGIVFTGSYSNEYTTVSMNVEGISKLSWTIGHIDNAYRYAGKLNVYVDDELTESSNLTWNMELEKFELDLPKGAKVIRIELEQNDNQYAIADIKADSLDAGIECSIPTFSKASAFIDSGFNNTNVTKYTGSSKANSYNVNGRTYYQGLTFKYQYSTDIPTLTYNVENIDKLSFNIGRVDNSGAQNGVLYIYRDNEEYDAIPLKAYMPISECEVDLKGTKNLRFVLKADSQCTYALMNIHADALAPEIDYTTPKYDKVSKFIDSVFNTNYISWYNGSTKADYYNMNGRTYYEGIVLTGDYGAYDSNVCLNVEDVNKISWTMGHVDDSGYYDGMMYVYLDEELIDKVDLEWWMKLQDYSIDVSKGNVLRVYLDREGGTKFALADIAADDRKTSNPHVVPKYDTVKDFLKSGYNSNRVTIYNGESPKINKFFMSGDEYTQGIRYYGEYGSYDSAVSFNTENVKSINFKIGHVDETGKSDAKLIVYKNGLETESIPLTSDMLVKDYTIDTSDAEYVRFYLDREGGSEYAMADIKLVSSETPAVTTTTTAVTTSTTTTAKPVTSTTAAPAKTSTTTSAKPVTSTTTIVTTTVTTGTTKPVEYKLGDVNNDGKINAVDASTVLTYYANISTNKDGGLTEAQKKAADIDNNGDINAVDASYILSYYAYTSTTKEEIIPIEEYMKKK
ncbi:NPCBM/NEW2 domain-containing protein [Ruminococcus flavefaciens]|uniref:NPCBM/NEW2 domain-containing protein n=1 Tax=Ruminococcus flavefaciens TaxID=1265 RepID=UPI0004644561|nr:NPCBM/NEW2 domain-containing protein [Ruminococcus flavefaciens]